MNNLLVFSVGGSIMSLSEDKIFNIQKAQELKEFVERYIKKGYRFVLCLGGGYICRRYQKILADSNYSKMDQHNIGVATINLNAVMLKAVFGDLAEEKILRYEDYDKDLPIIFERSVLISAAGSPGHSSDWNTVKIAIRTGAKKAFNLTNVDGVYTKDPRTNPDARKLDKLSWGEYLNIIGNPTEFTPGGHYPIDPIAARLAEEKGISFYVLDGDNFSNIGDAIDKDGFIGTTIY